MSLRIRRGTNAQRSGVTFDLGELVWTTDTERLYVGDGITAGAKNILAQSAGVGLVWNPTTQAIDISGSNLTTTNISEGVNLYFTPERAQDSAASLFTTGTHTNISFFYDDAANKINATVTLDGVGIANVQADPSPTLGGNLTMNGKVIQGTGSINITGNIAATTISGNLGSNLGLNNYNITGTGSININGNVIAPNIVTDNLFTTDSNSSGLEVYTKLGFDLGLATYNGTRLNPTTTNPGDNLGSITIKGYNGSSYPAAGGIFAQWDATANLADNYPKASLSLVCAAGGNNAVTATLQPNGLFQVSGVSVGDGTASTPSIVFTTDGGKDSGFFHPGDGIICVSVNAQEKARFDGGGLRVNGFMKVAQVSGTLPSPAEAGMIVLDGSTFKGYNGTSWVNLN